MSFNNLSFRKAPFLAVVLSVLLFSTACGADREFAAITVEDTLATQSTEVIWVADETDETNKSREQAEEPETEATFRSAELPIVPQRDCPQASFAIDGQDLGFQGGLHIEANEDGSQSLWTSFGDIGVEIPLEAGEPDTELSTISESGFRLSADNADFEPVDGGWHVAGSLESSEDDSYPFEACLVPDPSGTWIHSGSHEGDLDHTGWEIFDLVSSFDWRTDVRLRSELGEFERMEIDEIIARGDGVEAQEGSALVQRIADAFNESQAGVDPELQQRATPLFHVWNTPPVSYLLINGGGDDSIEGFVMRIEMATDDATGWAVSDVSVRSMCLRGVSDGLCV